MHIVFFYRILSLADHFFYVSLLTIHQTNLVQSPNSFVSDVESQKMIIPLNYSSVQLLADLAFHYITYIGKRWRAMTPSKYRQVDNGSHSNGHTHPKSTYVYIWNDTNPIRKCMINKMCASKHENLKGAQFFAVCKLSRIQKSRAQKK